MALGERSSSNPVFDTVRINLQNFADTMDNSKRPSDEEGVRMQMVMLSTLKLIFRLEGEDFNTAFKILLEWIEKNVGNCMGRLERFRYLHLAKRMAGRDQDALQLIVNLGCMITDKAARQAVLTRFDFNRLDRIWTGGSGGDKLNNYFSQL